MTIRTIHNTDENELLSRVMWKKLVKERADYYCEECGANSNHDLEAHHKDRDKTNNRLSNGQCLCRKCHRFLHKRLRTNITPPNFLKQLLND